MSNKTKLKLLIPVIYAVVACIFFTFTWPENSELHHWAGVIIALISFVLWIVSRVQLGNAFSLAPKSKFIVKSGIYSRLRHPVYYFSITAVLGIVIYTLSLIALLALVLLVLLELARINAEEKILIETFGNEYLAYRKSTWF